MAVNLFAPKMQALLDCVTAALDDADAPVASSFLAPGGTPAWDNCCENGGQAWVRLVQAYPSAGTGGAAFPGQDTRPRCHPNLLAARLEVGVLRCSQPFSDEQGTPPTDARKTLEGTATTQDASTLLEAILCCFVATPGLSAWVIDNWTPLGPNGGCVGGAWQLVIGVPSCACPEV